MDGFVALMSCEHWRICSNLEERDWDEECWKLGTSDAWFGTFNLLGEKVIGLFKGFKMSGWLRSNSVPAMPHFERSLITCYYF